jgi:DNA-directed RNA polymerase specialized sigma24 family protein
MAGTSQQVKDCGQRAVPLQRDVRAGLAALSEEDLLRLRAIARLRARSLPGGMSWCDLLHEAVLRALTGTRPWPTGVPLLAFLAGIMRSLCDEQWRHHRRQNHLPVPWDSEIIPTRMVSPMCHLRSLAQLSPGVYFFASR